MDPLDSDSNATGFCCAEKTVERTILAYFTAEEVERFWGDRSILETALAAFNVRIHWVEQELDDAAWRKLLLQVRPEVVIGAWSLPAMNDSIIDELPEFKYLCYFCGSIRGKVSQKFIARGGIVTNWGALASSAVAECAVALMLACARRMSRYTLEMHVDKSYNGLGEPYPVSISGRSIGIHGMGAVARHCVRLLSAFSSNIECWSQDAPQWLYEQVGAKKAKSLEELYTCNDIVIEAEALNERTEGSVSTQLLCRMKSGAIFVNVGRGAVLEEGAVEALAARGDVTLGLDVYWEEPLPQSSPLRGMRNVMLLPHTAGPTVDQYERIRDQSLHLLENYLRGNPVGSRISVEAYERMT